MGRFFRGGILALAGMAAIGLTLTGCGSSYTPEEQVLLQGGRKVTRNDWKDLLKEELSVRWATAAGTAKEVFRPDGTVTTIGPGGETMEGRWRLMQDMVCEAYPTSGSFDEFCFSSYKLGRRNYKAFNEDGKLIGSWSAAKD